MLILLVLVGIMVTSQAVAQTLAGISRTRGEVTGKAASFVILALVAAWLLSGYLRNIAEGIPVPKSTG